MWRLAVPDDDDAIARLCHALYEEDPSPEPVPQSHISRTLAVLRSEPVRGRAVVLELDGVVAGYALLVAFWSNELGGEICEIDELYVAPAARGRGHGGELLAGLASGALPWAAHCVALALETTPANARARRLYERAGFHAHNQSMVLRRARVVVERAPHGDR